jgi:hypothetical protein
VPVTNERGDLIFSGRVAGIGPITAATPLLWARRRIAVGESDLSDIKIELDRAPGLVTALIFDGRSKAPSASDMALVGISLQALNRPGFAVRARLDSASGRFEYPSLPPEKYLFSVSPIAGWFVRSISVAGRALSSAVLDATSWSGEHVLVTLQDRSSGIRGSIETPSGRSSEGSAVFIFPTDRRAWNAPEVGLPTRQVVTVSKNGLFTSGPLPPTEYFVAAVDLPLFDFDWRDHEVLARLATRATRVVVPEGQQASVVVRQARLER